MWWSFTSDISSDELEDSNLKQPQTCGIIDMGVRGEGKRGHLRTHMIIDEFRVTGLHQQFSFSEYRRPVYGILTLTLTYAIVERK